MANMMAKVGAWAFIVGVIIALLAGLVPSSWGMQAIITAVLVIVGLIVGFLNVTDKETSGFLMAAVAVMIALFTAREGMANMTTLGFIGEYLINLMAAINVFVFPATIVVALKAIYALAQEG